MSLPSSPAIQASSRINNMLEWAHFVENHAIKVTLGPCDDVWYDKHNGTTYATLSQILMERGNFSNHHSIIWQNFTCIWGPLCAHWLASKRPDARPTHPAVRWRWHIKGFNSISLLLPILPWRMPINTVDIGRAWNFLCYDHILHRCLCIKSGNNVKIRGTE